MLLQFLSNNFADKRKLKLPERKQVAKQWALVLTKAFEITENICAKWLVTS